MDTTLDVLARTVLDQVYSALPSVKGWRGRMPGVLAPGGTAAESTLRAECLLIGDPHSRITVRARFLHPLLRSGGGMQASRETSEHEVEVEETSLDEVVGGLQTPFEFPPALELDGDTQRFHYAIDGKIELSARQLGPRLFRVNVRIHNLSPADLNGSEMRTMGSTHLLLHVRGGEFVSLASPPEEYRAAAAGCTNLNVWPVLVGVPGRCDTMMVSPVAMSDYPRTSHSNAVESPNDAEVAETRSRRSPAPAGREPVAHLRTFAPLTLAVAATAAVSRSGNADNRFRNTTSDSCLPSPGAADA